MNRANLLSLPTPKIGAKETKLKVLRSAKGRSLLLSLEPLLFDAPGSLLLAKSPVEVGATDLTSTRPWHNPHHRRYSIPAGRGEECTLGWVQRHCDTCPSQGPLRGTTKEHCDIRCVSSRINPSPVGVGDSLQHVRRLDKLLRRLGG